MLKRGFAELMVKEHEDYDVLKDYDLLKDEYVLKDYDILKDYYVLKKALLTEIESLARLDRVLRSAARLVGGLSKFSSITAYMRDVLHWLPISERIQYRITAMVSRCVLGCAPSYL